MADGCLQTRAVTTGGRLQPLETDKGIPERPKTHHPFVTKIQVRIKRGHTESECPSRNDTGLQNESPIQLQSVRPTNFKLIDPPVTRPNSKNTFYEESKPAIESRRETIDELRRRRLRILGERASASALVRNEHDKDSLYRPHFSAKDCGIQLLLVRELTQHLQSVERETRSTRIRHSRQRLPVFHGRATKGERVFGINKWDY